MSCRAKASTQVTVAYELIVGAPSIGFTRALCRFHVAFSGYHLGRRLGTS